MEMYCITIGWWDCVVFNGSVVMCVGVGGNVGMCFLVGGDVLDYGRLMGLCGV